MKLSQNKWPLILMSLALLAVVLFGVIAYFNTARVRAAEQEVTNVYKIRAAIERLHSTVYGTESFHRGYLITGEQQYLDDYDAHVEQIDENLDKLRDLVSDRPQQLARLTNLDKLIDQKKSVLTEALDLWAKFPKADKGSEWTKQIDLGAKDKKLHDFHNQMLEHNDARLKTLEQDAVRREAITKSMILLGNVLAIGLAALAILAWRRSSGQLESSESKREATASELNAIVESASEGIITFGSELNFRFLNPAAKRIHQIGDSEILGTPILNMVPERLRIGVHERLVEYLNSNEEQFEFREGIALRSDGAEFPVEGTISRSMVDGEQVFTQIFTDLSDQKQLLSMMEQQSQLFDQIQSPIHICDMDDKVVFWNRESERVFGISAEEAIGKHVVPLIYAAQADQFAAAKKEQLDKSQFVVEWQLRDKDDRQIVVEHRRTLLRDWEGKPSAQLMVNADITQRKQTEVRTQRALRLESIGTFAGGVAHDLNNVLSPILMAAKMLKRGGEGTDNQKLADTIVVSAERSGKMIRKLLAFAGGESSTHEPIKIRAVVDETKSILAHALPDEIELNVQCAGDLHPIKGDPTEISQVLMNLAVNGRDAMPKGGKLEIRVENSQVDEAKAARSQVLEPGNYVCLTVSDTGEGILPEIIDKIFDPFFTTKPQGKGTGLGLATTMGIVRSHNGEILVYSEPDHGTSFSVYLPAHQVPGAPKVVEQSLNARGHGQTILLVDDESLILETAQAALELNGYEVITAGGGAEAVSIYQHQGDQIALVILDVMMPGMDGLQTKDALREINPNVKVIATSGLRRPGTEGSRMKDVNDFLPKPYSDDQLFELVARVLSPK